MLRIPGTNLFGLMLLLCLLPATASADWDKRKDKDGIVVYTREVEGSQLKEFRVASTYAFSVTQIVKVLQDVDTYMDWMPVMAHAELVSRKGNIQHHYIENKAPWPVSNRDAVYRYEYLYPQGISAPFVQIKVTLAPDKAPIKDGIVRMTEGTGVWTIKATPAGTYVEYQMHADPGGKIPSFLVNMGSVKAPYDTLEGLREYLTENQIEP